MKKKILLLLLLALYSCNLLEKDSSSKIQENIKMLNFKSDSLTINDAILEYKKGNFTKNVSEKAFYSIKDLESTWLYFKIDSLTKNMYFINWNSYLKKAEVFTVFRDTILELQKHKRYNPLENRNINYRLPTWKLEKNNLETAVFIKIKDDDRHQTNFKFLLLDSNEFLKLTQKDNIYIVAISTFLIILGFIILILFCLQKQYNMLWYFGYIFFIINDYLIFKGIWLNEFLFNNPFLLNNLKTIIQTLVVLFAAKFFSQLYPFTKKTFFVKKIFKTAVYINILVLVFFIYKFIIGNIVFNLFWFWIPIRIAALLIIIAHFILILKKIIPFYLGIAFLLTMIFALVHLFMNPDPKISIQNVLFLENFSMIFGVLETLFITYYIINKIIKERLLGIQLKQENLTLRNNFQNNLLKIKHQEQNKLVSNVHDTFGGYLEALKLRLLHKSENTPEKIQKILDAFYKDYRYLLNSLYAPKINSKNFIESLIEFCNKLNPLTEQEIKYNFNINNIRLNQEKCVHLYRIISELTTNAIKYSKSSEININLFLKNYNTLFLEVSDNGVGFEKNIKYKKGLGLNNVEERVQQMKGVLEIKSSEIGTKIKIKVSIDE